MAHIFKHIESNLLYTIEHLIRDIRLTNGNNGVGIYAYSYNHSGSILTHLVSNAEYKFDTFVTDNFKIVSII